MKIPDRKQIASDFNLQRKLQVDEGVKIAKKVDVLRETLASLEEQHRKFIAGTRQDLINQTEGLERKKADLQGELVHLEERRKRLLEPLDEEWTKLLDKQTEVLARKFLIEEKENQLNERESQIAKIEKLTEQNRQQISEFKGETERANKEARQFRDEQKSIRDDIKRTKDNQDKDFFKVNKELNKRDDELIIQRKYLDLVKKNLDAREKELDDKDRAIKDKYATLQRTLNRK